MHHKRDWSKYNRKLVNRGDINLWITPQALDNRVAKKEKKEFDCEIIRAHLIPITPKL